MTTNLVICKTLTIKVRLSFAPLCHYFPCETGRKMPKYANDLVVALHKRSAQNFVAVYLAILAVHCGFTYNIFSHFSGFLLEFRSIISMFDRVLCTTKIRNLINVDDILPPKKKTKYWTNTNNAKGINRDTLAVCHAEHYTKIARYFAVIFPKCPENPNHS